VSGLQWQADRDWLLYGSELAVADTMTGPQFEQYIATMLRFSGFQDARVVGGAGDGGVDILATDPTGVPIACQCKRQNQSVSTMIVRLLVVAVTYTHKGNAPYLVTTAKLTKQAQQEARAANVRVIDRRALGMWMAEARNALATATSSANPAVGNPGSGKAARGAVALPTPANPPRSNTSHPTLTAGGTPRPLIHLPPTGNRSARPVIRLTPPKLRG
jgi:restriction system protein